MVWHDEVFTEMLLGAPMASSNIDQIVVPLAVPIVTALVGAMGIVIRDTRMRKNQHAIRSQAFRDARDQVEFTTEWLAATQSASPTPEVQQTARIQANMWLEQAANRLASALVIRPDARHNENLVVRLFLIYRMTSRTGKILRVFFYLSFVLLGTVAITIASDTTSSSQADRNFIGSDFGLLGFVAVLTLITGFAASQVDSQASRARQMNHVSTHFDVRGAETARDAASHPHGGAPMWNPNVQLHQDMESLSDP